MANSCPKCGSGMITRSHCKWWEKLIEMLTPEIKHRCWFCNERFWA
jgi:hypothetical protein